MTDQAIQRCTANTLMRVGENDPGKNRICELPLGHSGPHAADYCGSRMWWYSKADASGAEGSSPSGGLSPASPAPDRAALLSAASVRGSVTHARMPGSRVAVCGADNVSLVEVQFNSESAYACKRCLTVLRERAAEQGDARQTAEMFVSCAVAVPRLLDQLEEAERLLDAAREAMESKGLVDWAKSCGEIRRFLGRPAENEAKP